ncbi:uncharacterized protein LOC124389187 [Silurus meridionalis]|uniref:Transmembrane protein 100 n=1 Tax=Silurus meridionalis TaxID=175797 RepID=A0A8T0BDN9_SILME|nr:uncharacterized protein LOC124389187 [Silurus meridionalis]KAF7705174.1 hypothetical protein HF521_020460 [Silurus meridionalis]
MRKFVLPTKIVQEGKSSSRGIVTTSSGCGPSLFTSHLDHSSEMGCSSGRLPCQPPASVQLPTLDPDTNLLQDGRVPPTTLKTPENLSTLERLTQATGGTEKSWYRCVFPFGVISLVIGMAGTGVTFTFNTLLQTKVVSLVLLVVGFIMLLVAAACWRVHRAKRKEKKDGVFFSAEQGTL